LLVEEAEPKASIPCPLHETLMLSSFRNLSKSLVGKTIAIIILVLIAASFMLGDIQNVLSGGSFTGSSDTLVEVGSEEVSDRDVTRAMDRRLSQVRQENPEATYATIAGDFDELLAALVDAATMEAFANKFDFNLSKRLVDGQIANIPAAKGLNGQFTEQSYQAFLNQQRITDEEVRWIIRNGLYQQLMIAPAVVNARAPIGMARPYASILLEAREGQVAFVPTAAFRSGLKATPADIQRFYAANQQRYLVPEQRVIRMAKVGPEQVANVQPTDKEIADFYNANRENYAPKETRVITQAVLPDQAAANALLQRIRAGQTFAAAAAPAGFSASDISLGPQSREQFTSVTNAQVAAAAWNAASGALVGPVQSENGWHVIKIESIERTGGRPLAAVRGEISESLAGEKRKQAIEAIVDTLQNSIDDGASFQEAAAAAKLNVIETPPITGAGTSQADPAYRFPADLAPALKTGFDLGENEPPLVESLPNDAGYVMVAPTRVIAAAPAPLATIRERVEQDWLADQATQRARQLAQTIATKAQTASVADAAKGTPVPVQVGPVGARRIQLSQFQGEVPPPVAMLFSLGQGKARMVAGSKGEGFYVVKVNRIIPGNAVNQPQLISRTQQEMQQSLSQEYGAQFANAMRQVVGVKRNEKTIAATKSRIIGGGN
jgi:peptidyl-prolyl cis-trans isomerase D